MLFNHIKSFTCKLTRITITFDRGGRVLRMYQDGRLVGKQNIKRKVFDSKPQFFYLGTDKKVLKKKF